MMNKSGIMAAIPKTIFIADDDPDYLYQCQHYLEKSGYQVVTCNSQREAEKLIDTVHMDLALLDLMMEQDDSGFILCRQIRKKRPGVPVIIATAVANETGIRFSLNNPVERAWINADAYLEKGVRPEQILLTIEKLLKGYGDT